ncbi:hypothetical protein JHL18_15535 [Clostridium sp. YIM B02505]|uniref:Uncharacterized protein n=1 Tax=Clostridium yunnanense TaxID=2800325 RepID=A0ABS1ERL3_9CLOT|nr:hypothetical protein [Clostridium yunnanense]MBK1812034.1 hypothetical protein [Clostridium yunnanense]
MSKAPEQQKMLLQLVIKEITITSDKNIKSLNLKFDDQIIKYITEQGDLPFDVGDPQLFLSSSKPYNYIQFSVAI